MNRDEATDLILESTLGGTEKLVLLGYMQCHRDHDDVEAQTSSPGVELLAAYAGCSESVARIARSALVTLGALVHTDGTPGLPQWYRINMAAVEHNPSHDERRLREAAADAKRPLFDGLFEDPGKLTHADVVDRALRWLRGHHGCKVAFAEINTYELVNPDAIGFRKPAGSSKAWSILVEAKVSRSDFRADREKMIHRLPDSCPGQERWYLTPPGMLRGEEIPAGWGLAEVGRRSVRIVVEAPKGEHVHGRAHADMGILLSAVRRHQVGAKWLHDLGKFEPWDGKA